METERVVLLSGVRQGEVVPVDGTLTIGRHPDSGLCLDDPQVSRRHAVIEQTPRGTVLRDLGSGNGTFVGERKVLESRLSPGDVIRIGNIQMRYEEVEEGQAQAVQFRADLEGRMEASSAANVFATFFQTSALATPQQQRDAQNRLAAVYKANQIISSERNLRLLFERVMEQIFSLVPAHNGVIVLKDDKTGELVTEYVKTGIGSTVISSTIVRRALEHGEAIITYDAAEDSRFGAGMSIISQNIASAMCAPLIHQDKPLGVVYVDTHGTTNAFSKSDLELLVAVAGPAGVAIRNAQYVHELEQAYHDTLIVLANAIEMRDHYTVGHTWRVTHFAMEIARAMGWSKEKVGQCETGGLLHDVGKIAVDDSILRKTAKLTDEEYAQMKVHPERGARMLRDVEFLKPMIPYCLYHHERYDGRGYPFGLSGDAIPIEGRVIAAADTLDAMTSNRPYRKGMAPEAAVQEILKNAGTQFDPAVAEMLGRCYREGKITRVMQESQKEGRSIVCPFCSTYIPIPEGAKVGDSFQCQVCQRHVKLQMQNEAFFGELLAETQ
ncbi:MAG TPA: HD domain-containing phosphohydrolase [Candidatus Bathyarchaeia archaeon]|nr:HD domain-containing phosphohydrolase [Candidatus Bathyarchaeia archaeon]